MQRANIERVNRRRLSRGANRTRFETLEGRALLATIAVTTLDDAGVGSLREAISGASSGDTIDLTGLTGTITLTEELPVEIDLRIHGPGKDVLAISGGDSVRLFSQTGGTVVVEGLTLRDGQAENGFGGAWRIEGGSVSFTSVRFLSNQAGQGGAIAGIAYDDSTVSISLTDSLVTGNSAVSTGFVAIGGGISLYALDGTEISTPGVLNFNMTRSTLSANTATGPTAAVGGGLYARSNGGLDGLGGGVINATIQNSTIAGNRAQVAATGATLTRGGGLYFEARGAEDVSANDSSLNLTLTSNTIAQNVVDLGPATGSSAEGAGVYLCTNALTANTFDVALANNLIADNSGAEDFILQAGSSIDITNARHNLVGVVTNLPGLVHGQNGNLVVVDAKLGTLGEHGGLTPTIPLLYASAARDAGDDLLAPATDQRGEFRSGTGDIGAYEWHNTAPTWPVQMLNSPRVGTHFTGSVSAADPDLGQPLLITLIDGPSFLSLQDDGNGTATLSGTPQLSDVGTRTITLRVSDGTAEAEVTLTLVVRNSLHVSTTEQSGAGSIRQAIADAGEGDVVDLSDVSGIISLTTPLLITKDLFIIGPGRNDLTLSGSDISQIFVVGDESRGVELSIIDLVLADGSGETGGAIQLRNASSLQLENVRITNCHAETLGGAIASSHSGSSITLSDSVIDRNTAGSDGGALFVIGSANITRTTFSHNSIIASPLPDGELTTAQGRGGALYLASGTHTFTNSTIASNSITTMDADSRVAEGAGLYVFDSALALTGVTIAQNSVDVSGGGAGLHIATGSPALLRVRNSLLAGNSGDVDLFVGGFAGSSVVSHTLVGKMEDSSLLQNGVNHCLVGTLANPINARLGTLGEHGGLVPTVSLRKGSPAINAGSAAHASSLDQRGVEREGLPDLGAYEYIAPANLPPTWTTSQLPGATTSVPFSITVAASDQNEDETLNITLISGPAFLRIRDNGDGTAILTGTPTLSHVGNHAVQLRVSDGTASTTLSASIAIAASIAELDGGTLFINGTNGSDVITVLLGSSNTIRVTRGSTTRDFPLGSVSRMSVYGFGGHDSIKAQVNRIPTTVYGGDGNDTIRGGGGDDVLYGDSGADYLDTGSGRNKAYGGDGNDTITGGNSADRLTGENDDDVINGRGGPDILYGSDGDDYLDTGSDRNRANGGAGNDTLVGGNSADRLSGDSGNDSLVGNRGKDYLSGGDGTDRARIDPTDILDSIEVIV